MNQVFAGATALLITLALWGIGRKPHQSDQSINTDRNLISRTLEQNSLKKSNEAKKDKTIAENNPNGGLQIPISPKERLTLQKNLHALMSSGPEKRLEAVQIAAGWDDPCVIPLLKKALYDSDSQVVTTAASAMNKYRGKTYKSKSLQVKIRPPRNVSLMR